MATFEELIATEAFDRLARELEALFATKDKEIKALRDVGPYRIRRTPSLGAGHNGYWDVRKTGRASSVEFATASAAFDHTRELLAKEGKGGE